MIDLDQFKRINDQYGHETGDRVLRSFGKLLQQSFRLEDVVGRWGGEEFMIGMYGTCKQDGVRRLTEVLQILRQTTFTEQHDRFQVTFSAGVVQSLEDGNDLQTLYQTVDAALYQAKTQGRNCVIAAETSGKGEREKREETGDGRSR
jgi:diguanylate cyclase (GGDEF)-like protein